MTTSRRRRRQFDEVLQAAGEGDFSRAIVLARDHLQSFPDDIRLLDELDRLTVVGDGSHLRAEFIEMRNAVLDIDAAKRQ